MKIRDSVRLLNMVGYSYVSLYTNTRITAETSSGVLLKITFIHIKQGMLHEVLCIILYIS